VILEIDNPPFGNLGGFEDDQTLNCTVVGTGGDDRACQEPGPVAIPAASSMLIILFVGGGTISDTTPGQVRWGITTEPDGP